MITDRTNANVTRIKNLSAKGWANMNTSERAEWTGDPLTIQDCGYDEPVNLFNPASTGIGTYATAMATGRSVVITATKASNPNYCTFNIGAGAEFVGKTLTLSVENMSTTGKATLRAGLVWLSGSGSSPVSPYLTSPGSRTYTITEVKSGYPYLGIILNVSFGATVSVGDTATYTGVMVEYGSVAHEYVPYTPIVPTMAIKGGYNYSDLNRVESAVAETAERLGLHLETKTDWTLEDTPTQSDMDRYIGNIRKVRDSCPYAGSLPSIPSNMKKLTYNSANNIEQMLTTAYSISDTIPRCGELFCGEVT